MGLFSIPETGYLGCKDFLFGAENLNMNWIEQDMTCSCQLFNLTHEVNFKVERGFKGPKAVEVEVIDSWLKLDLLPYKS